MTQKSATKVCFVPVQANSNGRHHRLGQLATISDSTVKEFRLQWKIKAKTSKRANKLDDVSIFSFRTRK